MTISRFTNLIKNTLVFPLNKYFDDKPLFLLLCSILQNVWEIFFSIQKGVVRISLGLIWHKVKVGEIQEDINSLLVLANRLLS